MITPQYEAILKELEAGERNSIARKIFNLLGQYPKGLTRRELVLFVFNMPAQENINNDPRDRKIRDAIASMRVRLIPILSTSGGAGYRLDDSESGRRAMISELVSRRQKIDEQIRAASMAWSIPVEYQDAPAETQPSLFAGLA